MTYRKPRQTCRVAWKPKSHDSRVASVRYRCLAPLQALKKAGYDVELFNEDRLGEYQVVLFSKLYDDKSIALARRLKSQGRVVALDLCDNHLYNPEALPQYRKLGRNLREMLALSDLVICSSEALATEMEHAVSLAQKPIVIGDGVEALPANEPLRISQRKAETQLLWFGNHGSPNADCGMLDILNISEELERFARNHDAELLVLSNNEEKYQRHIKPLNLATRYEPWNYQSFDALLRQSDAVLIPITPNDFSKCKSNNRLATALNYRTPVIADCIPSYREFSPYVRFGNWQQHLLELVEQPAQVRVRTERGKHYVDQHWSQAAVGQQWAGVIEQLLVLSGSSSQEAVSNASHG